VSQLLPDAESVGDYTLDDLLGTVLGHRKIGVHVPEQKITARASNFLFFFLAPMPKIKKSCESYFFQSGSVLRCCEKKIYIFFSRSRTQSDEGTGLKLSQKKATVNDLSSARVRSVSKLWSFE
jgi:hypothetical protein